MDILKIILKELAHATTFPYICQTILLCNMEFNEDHVLSPGIHEMEWEEFYASFSFSPRRKELLEGLKKVVDILQKTGCSVIYIDGSFVSEKLEPGDWDACFDCAPIKTKDVFKQYPLSDRNEQKRLYGGELYLASTEADEYGNKYLEFFQQITGTGKKKGIVKIKLNDQ